MCPTLKHEMRGGVSNSSIYAARDRSPLPSLSPAFLCISRSLFFLPRQDKELEECTFAPRVNSMSRRAARSRRQALGENHLTVDDRLYDESVRR